MEEKKKRTGNVTNTSEVELQPKERDRKSRNSWADIYNETTALHKHKRLLGQDVETDDGLEWRVKWGQRVAGTSAFFTLICWVAGQHIATLVFAALVLVFAVILYYKNVSLVIAKRLVREPNVVIILVLALCNWIIDIVRPTHSLSSINSIMYVLIVFAIVFCDAVKIKSRVFVLVAGILFCFVNIRNIYTLIFEDWDQGVVLLKYTIQGNKYTFMKRSTQRSIYIQIMLFSMKGIYTLFKDKKQELMIFATGHIYRETGTGQENETGDGNVISPAEVELQDRKTRDRKASRNSWTDIYNETTALHKHKRLLGQEVETDNGLEWRVKWGQRGTGVSGLLILICWVAGQVIISIVFAGPLCIFLVPLYYKNVSFVIAKRLLREVNVVMLLVLSLCNWSIDIARPRHSLSSIAGLVYMLCVSAFVFLDAVKVKSRVFVIGIGILFVLINISNIYNLIFGDANQGVVLFKYTIQGNTYTFMKRSIKRSIYIQIMLFGINGIYTIFKDKKRELLIFATGNIYRETGTASKEVEQKSFVRKIKSEKSISV
eukprot:g2419.t1